MSKVQDAYESVMKFNDIAQNFINVDKESINNQFSFIFEELTEGIDAFENEDSVELLDAACDLFVTVSGLLQKLSVAGFDVNTAMERVNENNLSKFPKVGIEFSTSTENTVKLNVKHQVHVIKNSNGKIVKPDEFVPVDLSDLVPSYFFDTYEGEVT